MNMKIPNSSHSILLSYLSVLHIFHHPSVNHKLIKPNATTRDNIKKKEGIYIYVAVKLLTNLPPNSSSSMNQKSN